jgi:peroxiredoxin Q/BCP
MAAKASDMPEVGKKAPAFNLTADSGEKVRLSSLAGSPVIVYFYPKDDTPGCTIEAQEFRDAQADFKKAGAHVFGVSPDGVESHCKFVNKFDLNFALLADEDHGVCEKYGVWVEKNNYGRKYMGVQRATFLINVAGKIAQVWPKVKPAGHAAEVLKAVRDL